MSCFSEEQLNRISQLIREIEKLTDVEKLFLYLQLPCGRMEALEGKQAKLNNSNGKTFDLFAKKPDQETTQTYTWILSHLEVDPNVSLPKQEVYDEYRAFCQTNRFEPLCVADFGKAMKHAFPCIKPRRLGQRGNSRYCYSGLRKKYKIQAPILPDLIEPTFCIENDCSQDYNQIIQGCRDNPSECPINKSGNPILEAAISYGPPPPPPSAAADGTYAAINLKIATSGGSSYNTGSQFQPVIGDKLQMLAPLASQQQNQQEQYQQLAGSGSNEPRYIYGGLIQQPGTPDDDEYSHNHYQDFNPMSTLGCSQVFAASKTSASGAGQFHYQTASNGQSQQPLKSTGGFSACQQSTSRAPSSASSLTSSPAASNQPQPLDNCFLLGTGSNRLNASAHQFEASVCASPFQSPASTPYPHSIESSQHYNTHHNIPSNNPVESASQDYYPTSSEFVRYSG